ncbi:hypothetical protein A4A49_38448 [Nicotiana attenuata]|uniref:Uncharacterized protein n=1 Tax=Nicotiana attenuata TaxID=49451 RepID=A0A1J6KY25_NICAT|nr:hypothetical protein A4A49_38448 [Nicotiana attenuata]
MVQSSKCYCALWGAILAKYMFKLHPSQKKIKKGTSKKMIQNQRSEVQNEGKMKKDQVGSSKETLPKKQKQKGDDFESNIILSENSVSRNPSHALRDNNIDNNSKLLMKDGKDIDYHVQQGIPASAMLSSKNIIDLNKPPNENEEESCKEVIQNKRPLEHNGSINEKEQEDSFEEELPEKQQQEDNGEPEVNRVTCEDRLPDDLDYNVNSGSKLLTRDEKDKKYYIKQGIPRSIKFRCMTNLYKCTNRLSPVEDEYNWNLPIGENPNMSIFSTIKDSSIKTNKKNAGCKRKLTGYQKDKGEKDITPSSTSKIVKIRSADYCERVGNNAERTSSPNTIRSDKVHSGGEIEG